MKKIMANTQITRILTLSFCIFCLLLSPLSMAEPLKEKYTELRNIELEYKTRQTDYNSIEQELTNKLAILEASRKKLILLTRERSDAQKRLARLQQVDRENPDFGLGAKVAAEQAQHQSAHLQVKQEEKRKNSLIQDIDTIRLLKDHEISALKKISKNLSIIRNSIVEQLLQQNISQLQRAQEYVGTKEVFCGEQETVQSCRLRAKKEAELNASEKGSVVVIEHVSEIKNFKIQKDEVRSEVRAQLSNIRIMDKGWTGDNSYRYQVKAHVSPIISDSLRNQMRKSIVLDLDSSIVNDTRVVKIATQENETKIAAEPLPIKKRAALDDSTLKIISLFKAANARIKNKHFFLPKAKSAYTAYKDILVIEPNNKAAKRGIDKLEAAIVKIAKKASATKKNSAIKLIKSTLSVMPESEKLKNLLIELEG